MIAESNGVWKFESLSTDQVVYDKRKKKSNIENKKSK